MEREIVEDEIDLRDYLRVIWKNRLLILVIFLVSLISSAYYSYFVMEDEYLSEAKLAYISNPTIALPDAVEILRSQSTLSTLKIENIKNTNQILIQVKGNDPEIIKTNFEQYMDVAIDELNRKASGKSHEEYLKLDNMSILIAKHTEEINEKMKQKITEEADLEIKRLENQRKILAKFGDQERQIDLELKISDLKSIKDSTAPSSVIQQLILSNNELNLLNSQLTSINNKAVDLEIKTLELENNEFQVVELIVSPTNPVVTGPKRGLNIAIAAVLGLFIGVFASFFRNYIGGSASTESLSVSKL